MGDRPSNPVIDLLLARKATRSILPDPLPGSIVDELVEAARLAPSCRNNQPWRYLFLAGEEALALGRSALLKGNRSWAERAPLLVVGVTRRGDDCTLDDGRAYDEFDLGMSVMNIMLAATHHGLTARPMAGFRPERIREAFGLDDQQKPLVMVAIGRPGTDESHLPGHYRGIEDKPRERKGADEIARRL